MRAGLKTEGTLENPVQRVPKVQGRRMQFCRPNLSGKRTEYRISQHSDP